MGLYAGAIGDSVVVGAKALTGIDGGGGAEKVNVLAGGDALVC